MMLDRIPDGARRRFAYPDAFTSLPEYTAHAGQTVTVIRKLDAAAGDQVEPDSPDTEAMYRIRADDGWEGDAFESEITDAP